MLGRYPPEFGGRPRLLLAYADPAFASACGRYFRRLGWEVEMVASGSEARELAFQYHPDVVVLDVALLDESGWLTSAKISTDNPRRRIILVAPQKDEITPDRLDMVGADAAICREDGAVALAQVVLGKAPLPQAV